MLKVNQFTVGPFAENPYLLWCSNTMEAIIVDPGDEADMLWQAIEDAGVQLQAIVLTHAHLDHVGAVTAIRERAHVPVYLHPADDDLLAMAPEQGRMFGLRVEPVAPADHPLAHGDQISVGNVSLAVLHTPGHSPGSVCLYAVDEQTLIAGDTLFRHGVGRTDLPGGSWTQLEQAIHTHLWPLPDDVRVLPGHGPATTIGEERRLNPFVGELSTRNA
jgi:glyoxylase-like metal-dependent hydrolase (beta-lactamase superfamily II)